MDSQDQRGGSPTNNDRTGPARPANALPRADSNRTLLDIISDEGGGPKASRKKWRHFKEKLKRHNSGGRGSAWTSSVPVPTSDIPINGGRSASRHPSSSRISPIHDHTDPPNISAVPDARPPLLARNPSRAMESGRFDHNSQFPMRKLQREDNSEEEDGDGDEEEEEEDEEERQPDEDDDDDEEEEGGGEYNSCCVCMVRHKGTAFVPCGHSFCRLCSREMWVEERGNNCPLCNNYILEILDIF
ncbi:hypothetical protein PHJA_002414700 [Phtheirospermum japonicum]|uniref:RING-type domain-containing protein n=1 Tax=Phtheirospermum japonicum TaxID=374723 RepID=A0A830CQ93_9LAMI|nr:hypothetical protein PHJA_002414700 [Phtheirospermum japonicum]